DVLHRPDVRMGAAFDRRALGRQAEGVEPGRKQDIEALHPSVAHMHVGKREVPPVPQMQIATGVRKHYQGVVLGSRGMRTCLGLGPCHRPRAARAEPKSPNLPRDGVVRLLRDRKGRGGKVVTVIAGLTGTPEALSTLASELKRACGTGGTVRGDLIEIQGDVR